MSVYFLSKNTVLKGKIIRESKRGTAYWIKPDHSKKAKLINRGKVYETVEDANKVLASKRLQQSAVKKKRERELKEELSKKKVIVEGIYKKHGVEIPYLSWASSSIEELEKYQKELG
ncbi:hypothetical protein [Cytobacillus sp. IB215665]|uniref:hypothetical protein n=1 Tax=Cytobacillus sp. IB215665 TaxID=3097357 RepID=UPI002A1362E8|nr:hypothetical protein [Cytobacillus sp. IB215665]MDX8367807.1 hypothetical protein [Cytobacillus sp. IB215665]